MRPKDKTRILIPLDGSSMGEAVLLALYPLIRAQRVESTLFHVAESKEDAAKAEVQLEMSRKALESQGAVTRVRIVSGRSVEQILRQAESGEFDLIAMATHGRTGLDRVLMGSVAEEVVRTSPIPTLLCRNGARMGDWGRIVVALDGTPGSEEILGDAAKLARSLHATLYLVRVGLSLLHSDGYRGVSYAHRSEEREPYLENIAIQLITQGIPAIAEECEGMPGVEIPRVARRLDAGLICMTTEGRPEVVPGMDRSIAAEVIRTAPCPVYVRHMAGERGTKRTTKKPAEA
jgi:nucleotide-binding universal stress UspA family protein